MKGGPVSQWNADWHSSLHSSNHEMQKEPQANTCTWFGQYLLLFFDWPRCCSAFVCKPTSAICVLVRLLKSLRLASTGYIMPEGNSNKPQHWDTNGSLHLRMRVTVFFVCRNDNDTSFKGPLARSGHFELTSTAHTMHTNDRACKSWNAKRLPFSSWAPCSESITQVRLRTWYYCGVTRSDGRLRELCKTTSVICLICCSNRRINI